MALPADSISTPPTGALQFKDVISAWIGAASASVAIAQVNASKGSAQKLADVVQGLGQTDIAERLRSPSRRVFLSGLRDLQTYFQNPAPANDTRLTEALSETTTTGAPQAPVGLQDQLMAETEKIQALVTPRSPTPLPVTKAGQTARTIAEYVAKRFVNHGTDGRTASENYAYDASHVAGKIRLKEAPDLPPLSTDDAALLAFEEKNKEELERCEAFVAAQKSAHGNNVHNRYNQFVQELIVLQNQRNEDYDTLIRKVGELGGLPDFMPASKAYYDRDQAIRDSPYLKENGIHPREYDLLLRKLAFETKADEKEAFRLRLDYYIGMGQYMVDAIVAECRHVEAHLKDQPSDKELASELKRLTDVRFEAERIAIHLAQGKTIPSEQTRFDELQKQYARFLEFSIDAPQHQTHIAHIRNLQDKAEALYADYGIKMGRLNAETMALRYAHNKAEKLRELDAYRIEEDWQVFRYDALVADKGGEVPVGRFDLLKKRRLELLLKEYRKAKQEYQKRSQSHRENFKALIEESSHHRPFNENSVNRDAFIALWRMHEIAKSIRSIRGQKHEDIQLMSFAYRDQAHFLTREKKGMVGFEAFVEPIIRSAPELPLQEMGFYDLRYICMVAAREVMTEQLMTYARDVTVLGVEDLLPYLGVAFRPETGLVMGGAQAYPEGFEQLVLKQSALRPAVIDALHVGQLEFAIALSLAYVLGLPHVSILAQLGVLLFPTVGPALGGVVSHSSLYDSLQRIPGVGTLLNQVAQPLAHGAAKVVSEADPKKAPLLVQQVWKAFQPSAEMVAEALDVTRVAGMGGYVTRIKDPKRRAEEFSTLLSQLARGNMQLLYASGTRQIASMWLPPHMNLKENPHALHMKGLNTVTLFSNGMPNTVARQGGVPLFTFNYDSAKINGEITVPMPSEDALRNIAKAVASGSPARIQRALQSVEGFYTNENMLPRMRPGEDTLKVHFGHLVPAESWMTTDQIFEALGKPKNWDDLDEGKQASMLRYLFGARNGLFSRMFETFGAVKMTLN